VSFFWQRHVLSWLHFYFCFKNNYRDKQCALIFVVCTACLRVSPARGHPLRHYTPTRALFHVFFLHSAARQACAEFEASARAAARQSAAHALLNGSFEDSAAAASSAPDAAFQGRMALGGGKAGVAGAAAFFGGGGTAREALPPGVVEWAPGGFGAATRVSASNRGESRGGGDDGDGDAAAEGSGSRLSSREKQRRQIDRALQRLFGASSCSPCQAGSSSGSGSVAADAQEGSETSAVAEPQSTEALRQYLTISLALLPDDDTAARGSINDGSSGFASSSNSGSSSSNSSGSSGGLYTELLCPSALLHASKSPYGLLKAMPTLLVHAGKPAPSTRQVHVKHTPSTRQAHAKHTPNTRQTHTYATACPSLIFLSAATLHK